MKATYRALLLAGLLLSAIALLSACGNRRVVRADRADVTPDRWERLGERVVQGGADRDTIHVGGHEGTFSRIKLQVEGSALEMWDVVVVFGNGQKFSPNTRLIFRKGSWTRTIDLPGAERVIRRVTFKYGNLPGGGRARVELWAK